MDDELGIVCNPIGIRSETGIVAQFRAQADHVAEACPQRLIAHGDDDVFVARLEDLIGHDGGVAIADAGRTLPGSEILTRHDRRPTELTIEQGLIDELALSRFLARIQAPRECPSADHTPVVMSAMATGQRIGSPFRFTGGGHQTRFALRDEIVAAASGIRAAAAIARDRAEDQAGVVRRAPFLDRVPLFAAIRPCAHCTRRRQPCSSKRRMMCLPVRRGNVDRDAALVAIDCEEIGAFRADEGRPPFASLIADAGPFDFDHVGAEIAQNHRAEWAGERFGEIDDADTVEGMRHK